MSRRKFQIGDKVQIVGNIAHHGFRIGSRVKITDFGNSRYRARSRDYTYWINPKDAIIAPPVEKKARVKPTGPAKKYAGYRITRSDDRIAFGCGAVKVYRKDVLALADAYEKGYRETRGEFYNLLAKVKLMAATPVELEKFVKLYITVSTGSKAFENIYEASRQHFSRDRLLKITPETLRRIAG